MRLTILTVLVATSCASERSCPPSDGDFNLSGPMARSEYCVSFDLATPDEDAYEEGSIDTLCEGCLDTMHRDEGQWVAWGRGREVGDPPVEVCHVYTLGCLEDDIAIGVMDLYPNPDGRDCELFSQTDVEPACEFGVVFYPPL